MQKQLEAITFIQGTIATIGSRISEVALPILKDLKKRKEISDYVKNIIEEKTKIRKKINNNILDSFFR